MVPINYLNNLKEVSTPIRYFTDNNKKDNISKSIRNFTQVLTSYFFFSGGNTCSKNSKLLRHHVCRLHCLAETSALVVYASGQVEH